MRGARSLVLLTIPILSLQACAIGKPPPPVAAISAPAQATSAARIAEIKRQLARLCPTPLNDAALERAAAYVETHRDKDVVAIVDDLSRLDGESRICRGLNI